MRHKALLPMLDFTLPHGLEAQTGPSFKLNISKRSNGGSDKFALAIRHGPFHYSGYEYIDRVDFKKIECKSCSTIGALKEGRQKLFVTN